MGSTHRPVRTAVCALGLGVCWRERARAALQGECRDHTIPVTDGIGMEGGKMRSIRNRKAASEGPTGKVSTGQPTVYRSDPQGWRS